VNTFASERAPLAEYASILENIEEDPIDVG
jgi:hypothetical protein